MAMKNNKKIALSEGSEQFIAIKQEWEKKAKNCTLESLPEFLKELTENYTHDYGTICHAVAAAAIASAWSVDKSVIGGITGFQAGAIMWKFVKQWSYSDNKTGLKIVDYDNLLYPQYEYRFSNTLSQNQWKAIQSEAQKNIVEADVKYCEYLKDNKQYSQDISLFIEKYPDYHDRKDYYDHLGSGTGKKWEEYQAKKDRGFEFAPQEPYQPISESSPVYQHWVSITSGVIPFGFVIKE
jgi:hypothetical protein